MALRIITLVTVLIAASADHDPQATSSSSSRFHISRPAPSFPPRQSFSRQHSPPAYQQPTTRPSYSGGDHSVTVRYSTRSTRPPYNSGPAPYSTTPSYGAPPSLAVPLCALNTSKTWCVEDYDYPMYEIQGAAEQHAEKLKMLYASEEQLGVNLPYQYGVTLCPSQSDIIRPLRAINSDKEWRIIVNGIKVNYEEVTQTVRVEHCLRYGEPCPLLPKCYDSTCVQKYVYHRFLVYDASDSYFPFAIESFRLPASCSCRIGEFDLYQE